MSSAIRGKIIVSYYRMLKLLLSYTGLTNIKPNYISYIAMILGLISAFLFGTGYTLLAGLFLLSSGMFDTFDGTIARINNKTSKFGAILDSSLDRYVEFIIFLGILIYYRNDWMFYIVFLALIGSIMVSYTRARSEGLGISEIVGVMQRPERVILLAVGAIINEPVSHLLNGSDIILRIAIIIIAVFSNITSIQRIRIVKKYDNNP